MQPGSGTESLASKGEATRARIIARALELAARIGLEHLSIGDLAQDLGLSKSGLFAHFKSKERLLLDVLDTAAENFRERVFRPALKAPRGEARLAALFENWVAWIHARELPGGCVYMAGAFEWDDRPGPVRERVVEHFRDLHAALVKAAKLGVLVGEFRTDLDHLEARLLHNENALAHARRSFERLLADARV
jgi:AcrR family transcriptional regulator